MTPRRLEGRHVLMIFLGFFALILTANVTMATLAIRTFSGEDTKSAYVKGLAYNDTLTRREQALAAGYRITADAARTPEGLVLVEAAATIPAGAPQPVVVTATLRHPTNANLDRKADLTADGAGRFTASLADVPVGNWDVKVTVSAEGNELVEARRRVWLP
jgi:nitrogen fixation protein FixH